MAKPSASQANAQFDRIAAVCAPGFLAVGWSGGGLTVRAGGAALALFVLTYLYTPDLATKQGHGGQVTISAPNGVAAGEIKNSPITVNPSPAAPPAPK